MASEAAVLGGDAGVPRVKGLPWFGSLLSFAPDPLGFVTRAAALGDIVRYRLLDHELVQLSHPDHIEEVLVSQAKVMHKDRIYELTKPLLGNGLVTAEGEVWKRHRKLAAPSFTKKHVEHYADVFVRGASAYADTWTDGASVDLHHDMMGLTQRIVLDTLFGTDLATDTSAAAEAIETIMAGFVYDAQGPGRVLPRWIPTPTRRRSERAVAALNEVTFALIRARREKGLGKELLSRLIEARDDAGGGFTDQELRDEAVTVFVAGHETTSLALTYALLLMGQTPGTWERVHTELDEVLAGRPPTAADFAALRFTRAVILEGMRILPPVWAIGREAMEDVTIGGHAIEKGAQILVPQWVIHRDARWFDDPLTFRPERWLDGLEERLPRMAYLPFGGGPRVCIGNHFAMLEAVLVLATLAQRATLQTTAPTPRLMPSITLRPKDPVPARVSLR